ncbi:MAG: hypothetical protein LBI64_07440 [Coriobacteriales bacterium]|jgi:hypothetical protein|nr:hypothetical protein [Coriobacteriales bacterium]
MTRRFKTAEKNRTTYRYYNADGSIAVELHPGVNGVTEADILLLHSIDDEEVDAGRREDYGCPARYEAYGSDDGEEGFDDINPWLADSSLNPETILLAEIDAVEQERWMEMVEEFIEGLSQEMRSLYERVYKGRRTNVSIAAEDGVSETMIRKRHKQFISDLEKFFSE